MGSGHGVWAAEAPSVAADVAMVQPFIGETTALVVKVDPLLLSLPLVSDALKSAVLGSEEAYRAGTREAAKWFETLRAAAGRQPVYVTVGIPLSKSEWPVFLFLKETPEADRKQLVACLSTVVEMQSCVRDGVIVAMPGGKADVAAALSTLVRSPRQGLAEAFQAVEKYPIQLLLLPPDYVRRTVIELMPKLPRHLGGGSSDVLTRGLVWAALGVDPEKLRAVLVVKSASEEAARGLAEHLPKLARSAYETLPEFKQRMPPKTFESVLPLVAPQVDGDRFVLRFEAVEPNGGGLQLVTMLAAAVGERLYGQRNTDSFKQILVAMHNYHDTYNVFPPRDEVRDASGKSKLSWRVHLLPFVDETKLHDEFHLDEPWDSPHNSKLIDRMPKVYKSPRFGIRPGRTTFLAPVGEDTVFGGQKATRISDIDDGSSNTVVLIEVKPELAVPWTAPQDCAFDPKSPGQGLQVGDDGRFLAGLADGSVNRFRGNIPAELLLRLFRKSDRQPIDWRATQ
jgi:hypothetical protein